jgi:peptidoglycan/xylan/chitin deacetylase (PgdA/CDA1 family)
MTTRSVLQAVRETGLPIRAKSLLASLLLGTGLLKSILERRADANFAILTYHRILERKGPRECVQDGMFVDPETFDAHLRFLKKHFRIVPIRELTSTSDRNAGRRPLCVLTFDDGWIDFHENAYPVLKSHAVPATVFLATGFIETGRRMWPDRVSRLYQERNVSQAKRVRQGDSSNPIVNRLEDIKGTIRQQSETAIGLLKKYRLDRIERVISELSDRWGCDDRSQDRDFLSWREVREMQSSGLVSFGSHTAGHQILTTLSGDEIERELVESRNALIREGVADPSYITFCYPNGDYDDKIVRMVANAGYRLAVTTERGWNGYASGDPYRFRRISIHQDICSTVAMLGCRIAGFI